MLKRASATLSAAQLLAAARIRGLRATWRRPKSAPDQGERAEHVKASGAALTDPSKEGARKANVGRARTGTMSA